MEKSPPKREANPHLGWF